MCVRLWCPIIQHRGVWAPARWARHTMGRPQERAPVLLVLCTHWRKKHGIVQIPLVMALPEPWNSLVRKGRAPELSVWHQPLPPLANRQLSWLLAAKEEETDLQGRMIFSVLWVSHKKTWEETKAFACPWQGLYPAFPVSKTRDSYTRSCCLN